MENTPENKEKFMIQYWGQNLVKAGVYQYKVNSSINLKNPNFYLELRPLESITLEEIQQHFHLKAFKIKDPTWCGHKGPFTTIEYRIKWSYPLLNGKTETKYDTRWISASNFGNNFKLKELGFLVPYGDLSVKQLIEYGWVKLK